MNIKAVSFALIVISVTSGCASTVDTDRQKTVQSTETVQGPQIVQGTNSDSYDPDEVTCRHIAKTGTRFKTKVCATNRQWKESDENASGVTEKMLARPQQGRDNG